MDDRFERIKNSAPWMDLSPDARWLIIEVERLRTQTSAIRSCLVRAMPASTFDSDSILTLLDAVLYQRRGSMIELGEIHDILAEALGYSQDALDDPDSPCPGAWVTGEHTAASLALEAARKLKGYGGTIATLIRDAQETRQQVLEDATRQIVGLQHELAKAKRLKPKKRELEEIIDRLEREILARKEHCCCVFREDGEEGEDGDRLLPHPDCPTHGVEANDRRLAGEKALNTLAYVRKYFMGSEHGHEA